jgi:hypothetical protein
VNFRWGGNSKKFELRRSGNITKKNETKCHLGICTIEKILESIEMMIQKAESAQWSTSYESTSMRITVRVIETGNESRGVSAK